MLLCLLLLCAVDLVTAWISWPNMWQYAGSVCNTLIGFIRFDRTHNASARQYVFPNHKCSQGGLNNDILAHLLINSGCETLSRAVKRGSKCVKVAQRIIRSNGVNFTGCVLRCKTWIVVSQYDWYFGGPNWLRHRLQQIKLKILFIACVMEHTDLSGTLKNWKITCLL